MGDFAPYPWYELASASTPLSQGDFVFDCIVAQWVNPEYFCAEDPTAPLNLQVEGHCQDVVVMTQACDLEQQRIRNVILCPHYDLDSFYEVWRDQRQKLGQSTSTGAWKNFLDSIHKGQVWNLAMLSGWDNSRCPMQTRVVDFHEVFSVPRTFVEGWIQHNCEFRPRLLPPYREHLSQAFARYFMRVGLPESLEKTW